MVSLRPLPQKPDWPMPMTCVCFSAIFMKNTINWVVWKPAIWKWMHWIRLHQRILNVIWNIFPIISPLTRTSQSSRQPITTMKKARQENWLPFVPCINISIKKERSKPILPPLWIRQKSTKRKLPVWMSTKWQTCWMQ